MSFAIHGGKSKDAVKTRRGVRGVRIPIPPDGAPGKDEGPQHPCVCRSPSTHCPTRVRHVVASVDTW